MGASKDQQEPRSQNQNSTVSTTLVLARVIPVL